MRLIDANELVIHPNSVTVNNEDMTISGVVDIVDILEAPTVEAIPVEWARNWAMKNWVKSKKCEYDIIVSKLIDDWREANATDRQR